MGQMIVYVGHPGKRNWRTNLRNNSKYASGTNVFANLELRPKTVHLSYNTGYVFTDVCNKLNTTINDEVKQMNILCVLI